MIVLTSTEMLTVWLSDNNQISSVNISQMLSDAVRQPDNRQITTMSDTVRSSDHETTSIPALVRQSDNQTPSDEIRVLACFVAYQCGILLGCWGQCHYFQPWLQLKIKSLLCLKSNYVYICYFVCVSKWYLRLIFTNRALHTASEQDQQEAYWACC